MKKTKKGYEEHLNENCPPYDSEEWILGGKNRNKMYPNFGRAVRKHDPIAFESGYSEYIY